MERIVLVVVILTASLAQAQSLDETFDWMAHSLKPSEGNNRVVHRPTPRSRYSPDWIRDNLDQYHAETITKFSHAGCRVELDVDIDDNDMNTGFGKHFVMHAVDTFDLKDIDFNSIRITNYWDEQGKFLHFNTINKESKIHEESSGSSWKSDYHPTDARWRTDELCKAHPDSGFCDQPESKNKPKDLASIELGFSTPEFTEQFAKVFSHAVTLCGATVHPRQGPSHHLDIPAISREANGSVVSIIMLDKGRHPILQGSGFFLSKRGLVLTNYHVIRTGSSAVIKLPDGALFAVDGVLASDKERDVAVIKAHGNDFRPLPLGDSDRLQVGEEVVAIGNPLSLESTVSNGIVSAVRTIKAEGGTFLQTTAPISPGSSGGPLFNMAGEVVGITTSRIEGGENLNLAIPINDAKDTIWRATLPLSDVNALPDEPETETVTPE